MARGWESKAVEDQMEEAKRSRRDDGRDDLSPAALELRQRLETLRLSRSRVIEQMARARSEAHRQMLSRSLAEIDRQLAELNRPLSSDF
ncbi:MAG TPA: hypothetical protein VFD58_01015 [Blastocatellia bacterium]|nr:hypothetical protein [Blastocatellia bacterium]